MMHVKLPWDLVEEILYHVQPLSLIRFKIVCKQWNTLFKTKSFINNHSVHVRPQFFLWNDSKIYSASITLNDDPKMELRELPSEIPCLKKRLYISFLSCDGLLIYDSLPMDNKCMVFNPWLGQSRWIESEQQKFIFVGIGYDGGKPEKGLKIFGTECQNYLDDKWQEHQNVDIYQFETNEWKSINVLPVKRPRFIFPVSLNGKMYWIHKNYEVCKYFIQSFDFSKETYREVLCVLPWHEDSYEVLSTFRKDRLSVLKAFIGTDNIEIWVTKNKINIGDGENIKWMKFMTFAAHISEDCVLSYFIDDIHINSLAMCCRDENRKVCMYIVKGNVTKKIHIGLDVNHGSYVPSLMPVPS